MNTRLLRAAVSVGGVGLLAWTAWGAYVNRTTERVPYTEIGTVDGVELREYPETVVVATTAADENAAFRRLFEYIGGANRAVEDVSMTAPVATDGRSAGGEDVSMTAPVATRNEDVSMTAPVRTDRYAAGVHMEFFLPAAYTSETAPRPTDPRVELVIRPSRTIAALPFSGYARKPTVRGKESELLDTLEASAIETIGEPTLLQYNDPYTPPFMRHNEIAVEVALDGGGDRSSGS